MSKYAGSSVLLIAPSGLIWVAERRAPKTMADCYECPGGKLEYGETPLGAAVREMEEETGLVLGVSRFQRRGYIIVEDWEIDLYMVNLTESEVPKDTEEMKRTPWVLATAESLPTRWTTPGLGALISIYLQEKRKR